MSQRDLYNIFSEKQAFAANPTPNGGVKGPLGSFNSGAAGVTNGDPIYINAQVVLDGTGANTGSIVIEDSADGVTFDELSRTTAIAGNAMTAGDILLSQPLPREMRQYWRVRPIGTAETALVDIWMAPEAIRTNINRGQV